MCIIYILYAHIMYIGRILIDMHINRKLIELYIYIYIYSTILFDLFKHYQHMFMNYMKYTMNTILE